MRLSTGLARPCTFSRAPNHSAPPSHVTFRCCTLTAITAPERLDHKSIQLNWDRLLDPIDHNNPTTSRPVKIGHRWMEYQGIQNWDGLLDPLDATLRGEILRYGKFVDAAYQSFDFDPSSHTYATCRFPKNALLDRSGLPQTGYRITRNLHATSGIQLPRWIDKAPSWMATQSSWIGYVAVCQDKNEIARLGRRDVVIAFRGTATCLEWLENLRATLSPVHDNVQSSSGKPGPMVESGFLSLYNSSTARSPSLRNMVQDEIKRLLQSYGGEPLSLTITGHSLGAALATLAAYDIKTVFKHTPLVTVISFGGPRVGNRCFRSQIEKQGTKVLRIVNDEDLVTKVPGFVIDDDGSKNRGVGLAGLPGWIRKRAEDTQWVYAEVGRELRLRSKDSPYLKRVNLATCHELKTYLHLVNGFVSSTCPFVATVEDVLP